MSMPLHDKSARPALLLAIAVLGMADFAASFACSQEPGPADKDKDIVAPKVKAPSAHKELYAQEFYHSFKGNREKLPDFHWHGLDPQECVTFEPDGMRISLPAGHPGKRMGTGVGLNTTVKGDFEVTMRYELIEEPKAGDAGAGTGLFVWVDLNKPKLNRGFVSRVARDGKHFVTWYHLTPEAPEKPVDVLKLFPANDRHGRLRIVRTASVLYYYVAEGDGEEFKLLQQHPFGAEDLQAVRWGGQTGGVKASLEGRFLDLRIRADELPDLPDELIKNAAAPPGQAGKAPAGKARTGLDDSWLLGGLGGGLLVLIFSAIGLFLFLRRRSSTPALNVEPKDKPQESTATTSFTCPECGKRMKLRPAVFGKKVKCPQCGQTVTVPTNQAGEVEQ